jgi:hypothetical protein
MNGDDALERLREAYLSGGERGSASGGCPDPTQIWAAVRGELPAERSRVLLEHSLGCASCRQAWRLARELAAEGERRGLREEAGPGGNRFDPRQRWRWLAAAAALVLAVSLPLLLGRGRPGPPVVRGSEVGEIRSLLEDGADLPRDRFVLRWSPGPAGTRYAIRVADGDLNVIFEKRALEMSEVTVPETALVRLPPDGEVLWQVEAVLPDGARVTSRTYRNRICEAERK